MTERKEGVKLDAGKAPIVQGCFHYFPKALEAVALVSRYGKEKYKVEYSDANWRRVPDGLARYTDALGRHINYEAVDGYYDPESHLLHAAHAAWNALARLELLLQQQKLDDRFPVDSQTEKKYFVGKDWIASDDPGLGT